MAIPTSYMTDSGEVIDLISSVDYSNPTGTETPGLDLLEAYDREQKLKRSTELKNKELYRKGKLQYEDDGSLIHDSNAMIRAKEAANAGIAGVDWLLEASENIADFGQGDLIDHYDGFKAEHEGRRYSMDNKDFIGARQTTTYDLMSEYQNAEDNPNADKGVYTLRKFDGYNADGSEKYIYKYGIAETGADDRYREQYVADGFDIVEEKRFAGAEEWEKKWNASQEVLDARVLDNSFDLIKNEAGEFVTRDEASGVKFGSGKTELLNRDLLGTDLEKTQEDYNRNKIYSEMLTASKDERRAQGLRGGMVNAIKAGGSKLLVGAADTALDILTPGGDNTLLNEYNTQEYIDKAVGYDRTQAVQDATEAVLRFEKGDYTGGLYHALKNPEMAVESLPMMIAMIAPIPGSRVAGAARFMSKLAQLKQKGSTLTEIQKVKTAFSKVNPKAYKTYQKYENAPTFLKSAAYLQKNFGFHAVAATLTNDQLNERIANKIEAGQEGEVGMGEVLGAHGLNTALLMLDRISFKNLIGLKGPSTSLQQKAIKNVMRDAYKFADKNGKKQIATSILQKAGKVISGSGAEAGQEYLQTWGEIINAEYGVDGQTINDVLDDKENRFEAMIGLVGGLGAGAQISGAVETLGSIPKILDTASELYNRQGYETPIKNAISINDIVNNSKIPGFKVEEVLVNEIVSNGVNLKDFSIDSTDSFNKMIDKIVNENGKDATPEVKANLRKSYNNNIITQALNHAKAQLSRGNTEPLKNVMKLAKNLHEDPNVDFDVKNLSVDMENDVIGSFGEILSSRDDDFMGVEVDLTEYKSNPAYKKEKDAEVQVVKNQRIDELIQKIDAQAIINASIKQGADIDVLGENINVDDELLSASGMELGQLKKLLIKYKKDGGKKNWESVVDEMMQFGGIEETFDTNGKPTIKIKPSYNKYAQTLREQFINPKKVLNVVDDKVEAAGGATLKSFVNFAQSRWKKLSPTTAKDGTVYKSKRTANNLFYMNNENITFQKLINELEGLLTVHKVGENGFTAEKKQAIESELNNAKESLKKATDEINAHKSKIADFVKNVLGLDGFNPDNIHQLSVLSGIYTVLGNNGFEPMYVAPAGNYSIEGALDFKIKQLTTGIPKGKKYKGFIGLGLTKNKNFGKHLKVQDSNGKHIVYKFDADRFKNKQTQKKKTQTQQKQEPIKKHNASEETDVLSVLKELGVTRNKNAKPEKLSMAQIFKLQQDVINAIKNNDIKSLNGKFNWIDTTLEDVAQRGKRGTANAKKYGSGTKGGQTTDEQVKLHLARQLAEELNELAEQDLEARGTREIKKLMTFQKRIMKVDRFLPNTVNKDSGLTNNVQMINHIIENPTLTKYIPINAYNNATSEIQAKYRENAILAISRDLEREISKPKWQMNEEDKLYKEDDVVRGYKAEDGPILKTEPTYLEQIQEEPIDEPGSKDISIDLDEFSYEFDDDTDIIDELETYETSNTKKEVNDNISQEEQDTDKSIKEKNSKINEC